MFQCSMCVSGFQSVNLSKSGPVYLISECKFVEDSHEGNRACRSKSGARLSDFRVQRYNISEPNARIICILLCILMCIPHRKSPKNTLFNQKQTKMKTYRIKEKRDIRSFCSLARYTIISTRRCERTPFILSRRER